MSHGLGISAFKNANYLRPITICVYYSSEAELQAAILLRCPSTDNQFSPRGIFMKRLTILTITILFLIVSAMPAAAQDAPKSVPMQMYHVALVKQGPNWKSQNTQEGMDIRMQVIKAVKKGAKRGLVVTAGLVNDETDVEFIIIFNIKNKYEALDLLDISPNIKNGVYKADIYSWFAPTGLVLDK